MIGRSESETEDVITEAEVKKRKDTRLLALKMEEKAMSQRMQVISGSCKRRANRFSPTAPRRNTNLLMSYSSPGELILDF